MKTKSLYSAVGNPFEKVYYRLSATDFITTSPSELKGCSSSVELFPCRVALLQDKGGA